MVVVDSGKNRIRDLIRADIYSAEHGTSATDETVSDTDLVAGDATTNTTPEQTVGNKLINSKHILLSTVGNGTTYKEYGVFVNSGATLLSRVTYPDFAKTASLELHTTTTYRIK